MNSSTLFSPHGPSFYVRPALKFKVGDCYEYGNNYYTYLGVKEQALYPIRVFYNHRDKKRTEFRSDQYNEMNKLYDGACGPIPSTPLSTLPSTIPSTAGGKHRNNHKNSRKSKKAPRNRRNKSQKNRR